MSHITSCDGIASFYHVILQLRNHFILIFLRHQSHDQAHGLCRLTAVCITSGLVIQKLQIVFLKYQFHFLLIRFCNLFFPEKLCYFCHNLKVIIINTSRHNRNRSVLGMRGARTDIQPVSKPVMKHFMVCFRRKILHIFLHYREIFFQQCKISVAFICIPGSQHTGTSPLR